MEVFHGIANGKIIQLDSELGLPAGQPVTVMVQADVKADDSALRIDQLRQAFGAWAEDAEDLDEFLAWNHQRRKLTRPEIEP